MFAVIFLFTSVSLFIQHRENRIYIRKLVGWEKHGRVLENLQAGPPFKLSFICISVISEGYDINSKSDKKCGRARSCFCDTPLNYCSSRRHSQKFSSYIVVQKS